MSLLRIMMMMVFIAGLLVVSCTAFAAEASAADSDSCEISDDTGGDSYSEDDDIDPMFTYPNPDLEHGLMILPVYPDRE